jgi:hypothetical protein
MTRVPPRQEAWSCVSSRMIGAFDQALACVRRSRCTTGDSARNRRPDRRAIQQPVKSLDLGPRAPRSRVNGYLPRPDGCRAARGRRRGRYQAAGAPDTLRCCRSWPARIRPRRGRAPRRPVPRGASRRTHPRSPVGRRRHWPCRLTRAPALELASSVAPARVIPGVVAVVRPDVHAFIVPPDIAGSSFVGHRSRRCLRSPDQRDDSLSNSAARSRPLW